MGTASVEPDPFSPAVWREIERERADEPAPQRPLRASSLETRLSRGELQQAGGAPLATLNDVIQAALRVSCCGPARCPHVVIASGEDKLLASDSVPSRARAHPLLDCEFMSREACWIYCEGSVRVLGLSQVSGLGAKCKKHKSDVRRRGEEEEGICGARQAGRGRHRAGPRRQTRLRWKSNKRPF